MKMIGHEAYGMDLPPGFAARFGQRAEEALAILVIPKDGLPAVAPIHDVVHRTRIFDSEFTRHGPKTAHLSPNMCISRTDPFKN
jgi:hypothetical protein